MDEEKKLFDAPETAAGDAAQPDQKPAAVMVYAMQSKPINTLVHADWSKATHYAAAQNPYRQLNAENGVELMLPDNVNAEIATEAMIFLDLAGIRWLATKTQDYGVAITPAEYLKARGKSKNGMTKARQQLEDIRVYLSSIQMRYFAYKMNPATNKVELIQLESGICKSRPMQKRGPLIIFFDPDYITYAVKNGAYRMPVSEGLYRVDARHYASTYYIFRRIHEYKENNVAKSDNSKYMREDGATVEMNQGDFISVKTLMDEVKGRKTYAELIKDGKHGPNIQRSCIEPFKNEMNHGADITGLNFEYIYKDTNGIWKRVPDDMYNAAGFTEFTSWYVHITKWTGYPQERLTKAAERREAKTTEQQIQDAITDIINEAGKSVKAKKKKKKQACKKKTSKDKPAEDNKT